MKTKEVAGTLDAGVFTPRSFTEAQNSQLLAFFAANDFVSLASAKGVWGGASKERLEELFPGSVALCSVVAGAGLVATCKAALEVRRGFHRRPCWKEGFV